MKKLVFALFLLGCAGGGYYWYALNHPVQDSNLIFGNADIREADAAFEGQGRIVRILHDEGERVKAGEVLAELDGKQLALKLDAARITLRLSEEKLRRLRNGNRKEDVEAALHRLREAQENYRLLELEYHRKKGVFEKTGGSGISRQELDAAEGALKRSGEAVNTLKAQHDLMVNGSREEDISIAEIEIEAQKKNIEILEDQLARMRLLAPSDGVIRTRLVELGDMAGPSKTAFTILLSDRKWVRAYIDEPRLSRVRTGMPVTVTIDSLDRALEGTVGFISDVAEFTPKNVETSELRTSLVYEVRIVVKDPGDDLRMGVPVTVELGL